MELGQLGDEHTHQRHSVEDEMDLVILGIEAGEEVPVGVVGRRYKFESSLSLPGWGRQIFDSEELWERLPRTEVGW